MHHYGAGWIFGHKSGIALGLAALFVLFVSLTAGGAPLGSGVATGLGEAHPLDMGTAYSMGWNPAGLGFSQGTVQFAVTPLSARLTADNADLGSLLRQLTGTASEGAVSWPHVTADRLDLTVATAHRVQMAIGSGFGLSLQADGFGEALLTADLVDLLADRGLAGETYDISGATVDWAAYFSAGGGMAIPLKKDRLYVGVGVRRMQGWTKGEAWVDGDSITLGDPDATAELHVVQASRGSGYAFDVGAMWRLTDHVVVDASWLNIGGLTWEDPVHIVYTFQPTGPDEGTLVQLSRNEMSPMAWSTPQTVRAGMFVEANPKVKWAVNTEFSQPGEAGGEVRISVGSEAKIIPVLPLRLGAQYSTATTELTFSAGFGLHIGPLTLDVGVPNISALGRGAKEAGLAFGTRVQF